MSIDNRLEINYFKSRIFILLQKIFIKLWIFKANDDKLIRKATKVMVGLRTNCKALSGITA